MPRRKTTFNNYQYTQMEISNATFYNSVTHSTRHTLLPVHNVLDTTLYNAPVDAYLAFHGYLKGAMPRDNSGYGISPVHKKFLSILAGLLPPLQKPIYLWRGLGCSLEEFDDLAFAQTSVDVHIAKRFKTPKGILLNIRVKKGMLPPLFCHVYIQKISI